MEAMDSESTNLKIDNSECDHTSVAKERPVETIVLIHEPIKHENKRMELDGQIIHHELQINQNHDEIFPSISPPVHAIKIEPDYDEIVPLISQPVQDIKIESEIINSPHDRPTHISNTLDEHELYKPPPFHKLSQIRNEKSLEVEQVHKVMQTVNNTTLNNIQKYVDKMKDRRAEYAKAYRKRKKMENDSTYAQKNKEKCKAYRRQSKMRKFGTQNLIAHEQICEEENEIVLHKGQCEQQMVILPNHIQESFAKHPEKLYIDCSKLTSLRPPQIVKPVETITLIHGPIEYENKRMELDGEIIHHELQMNQNHDEIFPSISPPVHAIKIEPDYDEIAPLVSPPIQDIKLESEIINSTYDGLTHNNNNSSDENELYEPTPFHQLSQMGNEKSPEVGQFHRVEQTTDTTTLNNIQKHMVVKKGRHAEYSKAYRKRKKMENDSTYAQKNKERCRAYRKQSKIKKFGTQNLIAHEQICEEENEIISHKGLYEQPMVIRPNHIQESFDVHLEKLPNISYLKLTPLEPSQIRERSVKTVTLIQPIECENEGMKLDGQIIHHEVQINQNYDEIVPSIHHIKIEPDIINSSHDRLTHINNTLDENELYKATPFHQPSQIENENSQKVEQFHGVIQTTDNTTLNNIPKHADKIKTRCAQYAKAYRKRKKMENDSTHTQKNIEKCRAYRRHIKMKKFGTKNLIAHEQIYEQEDEIISQTSQYEQPVDVIPNNIQESLAIRVEKLPNIDGPKLTSVAQSQNIGNPVETITLIHGPIEYENKRMELDGEIIHHEVQINPNYDEMIPLIGSSVQNIKIKPEIINRSHDQLTHINNTLDENELHKPTAFHRPSQMENEKSREVEQFHRVVQTTDSTTQLVYTDFNKHGVARINFMEKFTNNPFGFKCTVCYRLWFKKDLKVLTNIQNIKLPADGKELTLPQIIENYQDDMTVAVCFSCNLSIKNKSIPNLSTYNGFKYPHFPSHLPKLDIISERLISPRIPFMQIKRLRHYGQPGQYKICGQIINIPIEIDTMVKNLPRQLSDEHSFYVHIRKKMLYNSTYLQGLTKKNDIEKWLRYLVETELYKHYNISINENFFDNTTTQADIDIEEVSEVIPINEALIAQQQTVLLDEDKYLGIAQSKQQIPISLFCDEHAEELSFPSIYLGQFRKYRHGVIVTPFMTVTSELRRADRRGATPNHVLYVAMKIMRLRITEYLQVAFKHGFTKNITKEQILQHEYINSCIEANLASLRSIPNSTWYWMGQKKDLFAMIRQLGRPTAFMTFSANEIKWMCLMLTIYKLQYKCDGKTDEELKKIIKQLSPIEKNNLVNEDPVTCALYFNKLVNVLMSVLMLKKSSPFGKYRVIHYFKRIEFQHRGSPHAHILLWLDNAPEDVFGNNYQEAVEMIDNLISISTTEASGNIKLVTHEHTDTCYNKVVPNKQQQECRFEAPFMPSRTTSILTPMKKQDENYNAYKKKYADIRYNLEHCTHIDIDDFYKQNNITSDKHYHDIIRAGITRPRIFLKRLISEKWHNSFNPFVFNLLASNMDFQIITDEYSCAQYVVEYIIKTHRGISNLQRQIIKIIDEHPKFDIMEITHEMIVGMLNTVEMSSQEAAWYLLREPMSKSSVAVVYIPTVLPNGRQRVKKVTKDSEKLDEESTDIGKENLIEKYENRPDYLNDVTLAQYVAYYYENNKGKFVKRQEPKVIRYRNYDIEDCYNDYRREMVTLHIPFKNENEDILLQDKYINIYEENAALILSRRKEFESNLDIQKLMQICRNLCNENGLDEKVIGMAHETEHYAVVTKS